MALPVVLLSFWNLCPALVCPDLSHRVTSRLPKLQGFSFYLPEWVTVRALLAGVLCSCLGFGHWQVIVFPTAFIGLDFDFFNPGSALQGDERQPGCGWPGQKPLPLAKLKKMHIPLQSYHERHTGPFCSPLPSHWQKAVSVFGERSAAGLLPLCPPPQRLFFLGPESVPVLACTQYSSKEQHNVSTDDLVHLKEG